MSYDIFVWSGPPVSNDDEAFALIKAACEGDPAVLEPSGRVTEFLAELFLEHPPLSDVGDDDDTVWSFTDDTSDRHALLSIQGAHAWSVCALIIALAARHGLRCFDPQSGELWQDGIPTPSSKPPTADSAIRGSTATPTDLFWLIFTKFRNGRDISPHFLGRSAALMAECFQSGRGTQEINDLATLLYVASCADEDLDSTISEAIDGNTAVLTVVPRENTWIRRLVHMRRIGRAWRICFPDAEATP